MEISTSPAQVSTVSVDSASAAGTWRSVLLPFLIFAALLVLGKINLGNYNLLVAFLLTLCATHFLFTQKRIFRDLVFAATVEEKSWLQWFRRRVVYLWVTSFFVSSILIISISVYLATSHMYALLALGLTQLLLGPVRRSLRRRMLGHLKLKARQFVVNALSVAFLGSITLVIMIAVKYVELTLIEVSVLSSADGMAEYVIGKVEHGIPMLQHLARTLSMFELELVRARQLSGGWIGDVILIYYLLPSMLAAFALPVIYSGLYMMFAHEKE